MYLDRPIGIDLGTTNSAVALLEPDGRDLLIYTDRFRRRVVPSVVAWDPGAEEMLVGFKAWNRRGLEPEPISSIKRKMGQETTTQLGPKAMTPQEISAEILKAVRSGMVEYAGARLDGSGYGLELGRAVITVPAYFDAPQIEATRKAGELAGLEVMSLLQEPTAAAMYYAWKHGLQDGTFMVYDLGGGTFDVSIIRCLMGEYQVLGIHGDNYLGGDDFDRRFAEHLRKHLVLAHQTTDDRHIKGTAPKVVD
ncbi:MAG: Hsp70 family protein, partial [Myxococcota bacterium]